MRKILKKKRWIDRLLEKVIDICNSRTTCLGCPYSKEDFYVECKAKRLKERV